MFSKCSYFDGRLLVCSTSRRLLFRSSRTPLHYAANYEVERILLGAGADADVRDDDGKVHGKTIPGIMFAETSTL